VDVLVDEDDPLLVRVCIEVLVEDHVVEVNVELPVVLEDNVNVV
jgi:hypothetical protein